MIEILSVFSSLPLFFELIMLLKKLTFKPFLFCFVDCKNKSEFKNEITLSIIKDKIIKVSLQRKRESF